MKTRSNYIDTLYSKYNGRHLINLMANRIEIRVLLIVIRSLIINRIDNNWLRAGCPVSINGSAL